MTRSAAQQRCDELNEAPAAEPGTRWMARESAPGDWRPIRLRFPGLGEGTGPLKTAQESRPEPEPADPRPLHNPFWGA